MERKEEIRVIAYRIWEEDGCCNGKAIEHWLAAETIWQEQQKPAPPKSKNTAENAQTEIKNNKKPAARKAGNKKP